MKAHPTHTSPRRITESELQAIAESLDEERIRARAYELFEQRGKEDGHDLDDWLQAEQELQEKARAVAA